MVEFDEAKIKSNLKTLGVWMYWIIGTVIIGTISYILYTRFNKQVASILVFLVSMMALYYYYVKWLVIPGWEPHIGTCPDFMTTLGLLKDGEQQFVCSDTLNAYKMGGSLAPNKLDGNGGARGIIGQNQPNADKGFVLASNGIVVTPKINQNTSEEVITNFCKTLKSHKISWINLCEM